MTLGHFVELAGRLGREGFLRSFREPLIVAMGVLEIEELEARCGSTVGVRISSPMSYDKQVVHPLAGMVFRVPALSAPEGSFVIGRDHPSEVVVPDDTISTAHSRVRWSDEQVWLEDLGSTNGTLLNLKRVPPDRPERLSNEDVITVGRHSFQYYLPEFFYSVLEGLASPLRP